MKTVASILLSLAVGMLAQGVRAQASIAPSAETTQASETPASYDEESMDALRDHLAATSSSSTSESSLPPLSDVPRAPAEGGGAVSGLSIALPSGPSTTLGMGESFSPQLSTGIGTYTVPLRLPAAAQVAPSTPLEMKRTLPSHMTTLAPAPCQLLAGVTSCHQSALTRQQAELGGSRWL